MRAFHVRAVREETREADFICSTDAIDRYGEIVEQTSWQLERFAQNPVALWSHQSRDLPIGQCKNVGVIDGKLQATIQFSKAHQKAIDVWNLVQEKTLRAVSVGFYPHTYRLEKRDDKEVLVLADNELVEISVCAIPANHEALAKSARAKALAATPKTSAAATVATEESIMTEAEKKALEDQIRARDAEARAAEKRAADAEVKVKALEAQNDALVKERDAALLATKAAEKRLCEHEVNALVGVKFAKDERDAQVELAMTNRPLFEKLLAQRGDMPAARDLTGKPPVVGDEPSAARLLAADDDGAALEAEIQKAMEA